MIYLGNPGLHKTFISAHVKGLGSFGPRRPCLGNQLALLIRSGHNFIRKQVETWDTRREFLIGNFENTLPSNKEAHATIPAGGALIDYSRETFNIVVVRDLLNWLASYLVWMYSRSLTRERLKLLYNVSVWYHIAAEAFNHTHHLDNKYRVVSDKFTSDRKVRAGSYRYSS